MFTVREIIESKTQERERKQAEIQKTQDELALEDGQKFLAEHKIGYIVVSSAKPEIVKLIAPGLVMKPYIAGYQIWIATEREWFALDMERVGYTVIAQVDENMKVLQDYYQGPNLF